MVKTQSTQKRKSPSGKEAAPRKENAASLRLLVLVTFVGACMFVVGILVGRGTAPVRFDIQALQKELAELRQQVMQRELRQAKLNRRPIETKAELDFYEALKEEDIGEDVALHPPAQQEPVPPKAVEPETKTASPPPPARSVAETPARAPAKPEPSRPQPEPEEVAALPKGAERQKAHTGLPLTVQVASMREWGAAADTVALLKRRGFPAYLVEVRLPEKGTWYRVRVGSFPDAASASDTIARLKGERFEGIIVPRQ
ncbi:MAG: SPOR domain-containing protein [Desulfobacteraceae bacterium]|nr:SPOR domain-containing protein [Desulfobacteraceae bacterium]